MSEAMNPNALPSLPRRWLAACLAACLGVPWAHAVANALNAFTSTSPEQWAAPLTGCALAAAAATSLYARGRLLGLVLAGSALAGAALVALLAPAARAPCVAGVIVAATSGACADWIARKLPESLDRTFAHRPVRLLVWSATALLAVLQIARLSNWISDPSADWFLSTRHPFWAKHECLPAYLYGAELAQRGEPNVYSPEHYPGLNPAATPHSSLQMNVEDPYQYAPQFLLWPAAALELTHDYASVRAAWFATQLTLLLAVAIALAAFAGGRVREGALWLLPLGLSAFPMLHALQYGQFHLAAVVLAVAAMLAFERGRLKTGGALLALATLSKLFPGVLIFVLLAQRRLREFAYTMAAGAALTLAAWAAFGAEPFAAFFSYHLPRLRTGDAFAFGEAWPEVRAFLIAADQGVHGVVLKLGALGVPGAGAALATWLNTAYAAALAAAALWVGRRLYALDRPVRARAWLALLGLASLMSTGAFADYVPLTAIWLLTLSPESARGRPRVGVWLVCAAVTQYSLIGSTPLGDYFDPRVMIPLSLVAALVQFCLFVGSLGLPLRVSGSQDAALRRSQPILRSHAG